ncbi:NAD(P)H-binding protein [Muricauda oceani]|uniref:NAD(P)H-binding protein n=1 Tax=Flagellimonas oceani TaxID=2698672 RepID=A0A6G7J089_9FLAO|nr:NAD(P)H-binding protein [Allomuricauda oceani]MBW8243649.1 NAD(P)H-binding protein [Allomuricauda oceani]QII43984.1 NAD(P)H-binding protein [Allomuricauda oceani]
MNILVVGASGRVGLNLVKLLLANGHTVIGTSRSKGSVLKHDKYSQIELDLTDELEIIKNKIPDTVEAIYFVSGSRGKNLLQIDLHGAVKTMQAAEFKGIERYVMLSAIHSLSPEKWQEEELESLTDYYLSKHYADLYLMQQTKLNYTILQPGALTETKGSGLIALNVVHHKENAIENVAETLSKLLNSANTYQKVISMHDGDVPIQQAIDNL